MSVTLAFLGLNTDGVPYTSGSGKFDITRNHTVVDGSIVLSGNYGGAATHGDVMDFTSIAPPPGTNIGEYAPTIVEVYEAPQAGAAASGFTFIYCPGPNITTADGCTQAGGVLQILGTGAVAGSGAQEITQGVAYPAGLLAATLRFRAYFARN